MASIFKKEIDLGSNSTGIVICVGNGRNGGFAQLAYASLKSLKSQPPIEIFHVCHC